MSLHHSDHDGVVRISVRHSEIVKRFNDYIILYYITRHNFSYKVGRGNSGHGIVRGNSGHFNVATGKKHPFILASSEL